MAEDFQLKQVDSTKNASVTVHAMIPNASKDVSTMARDQNFLRASIGSMNSSLKDQKERFAVVNGYLRDDPQKNTTVRLFGCPIDWELTLFSFYIMAFQLLAF